MNWRITTDEEWRALPAGTVAFVTLTPIRDVAAQYGGVVLAVDYDPVGPGTGRDNFGFDPPPGEECWQFSVFVPIPVAQVSCVDPAS